MQIQKYVRKPRNIDQKIRELLEMGRVPCMQCEGHTIELFVQPEMEEGDPEDIIRLLKEICSSTLTKNPEIENCLTLYRMGIDPTTEILKDFKGLEYNGKISWMKLLMSCGPHYPSSMVTIGVEDGEEVKGFVYAEHSWRVVEGYVLKSFPGMCIRSSTLTVVPLYREVTVGNPVKDEEKAQSEIRA